MQTRTPLTEWEAKERAGLLALETAEWREKRLIAEDPNTTGAILKRFADEIIGAWTKDVVGMKLQGHLLVETIAAHPNTPPTTLLQLINLFAYFGDIERSTLGHNVGWSLNMDELVTWAVSSCARGICRNPITPLLCLEIPDFWERGDIFAWGIQMREATLPSLAATQLTHHSNDGIAKSAHFRVSRTGEIRTRTDGLNDLTAYWRTVYLKDSQEPDWSYRGEYIQLVKMGIVPAWENGKQVAKRQGSYSEKSRNQLVRKLKLDNFVSGFMRFVANHYGTFDVDHLQHDGVSPLWMERLHAALKLPITKAPFSGWYPDPWNRTLLDLINHFAHDGNRFVRWAAQTRLADPDFVFTWQDNEG